MAETESENIEQPEPAPEQEPKTGSEKELDAGPEQEKSTGFVGKILAMSRLAGPVDRLTGMVHRVSNRLRQVSVVKLRIGMAIIGIVAFSNRDQGPTPHQMLQTALKLIDNPDGPDSLSEAAAIAMELRKRLTPATKSD